MKNVGRHKITQVATKILYFLCFTPPPFYLCTDLYCDSQNFRFSSCSNLPLVFSSAPVSKCRGFQIPSPENSEWQLWILSQICVRKTRILQLSVYVCRQGGQGDLFVLRKARSIQTDSSKISCWQGSHTKLLTKFHDFVRVQRQISNNVFNDYNLKIHQAKDPIGQSEIFPGSTNISPRKDGWQE